MPTEWNQTELERHIADQVEEKLTLDYKAANALGRNDREKTEITKDVSAMANSDGGVIVYGMAEYQDAARQHLPERIDPIDRTQFSREWLEQIINNIRPRIDGIRIYSVPLNSGANDVAYVVEIPKGTTAHQASDKRYYKRYNFLSIPMEDYEIRDVMNRMQHPKIDVSLAIVIRQEQVATTQFSVNLGDIGTGASKPKTKTTYTLQVNASNVGNIYAQYVNCFIQIPRGLLPARIEERLKLIDDQGRRFYSLSKKNSVRDIVDVQSIGFGHKNIYGPYRYVPILPGLSHTWEIDLREDLRIEELGARIITWTVYADNALPVSGQIKVSEVPARVENGD